jgi:GcrA cell cycle regulator
MSTGWDSNMLKKLKALVGKGLSTAEMGKKLGMSKNAVVGKLNRLGWNAKATETTPKKAAKADNAKKPAAKKAEPKAVAAKKPTKQTVVAKKPVKAVAEKATKAVKAGKADKKVVKAAPKKEEPKKAANVVEKVAKPAKQEKVVVKTASKKTKKDLALHELLIQHALQMANLKPNQCRWPIGDPDADNFHFCGETVFAGKPYCYEHCRQAYQFTPPKKK